MNKILFILFFLLVYPKGIFQPRAFHWKKKTAPCQRNNFNFSCISSDLYGYYSPCYMHRVESPTFPPSYPHNHHFHFLPFTFVSHSSSNNLLPPVYWIEWTLVKKIGYVELKITLCHSISSFFYLRLYLIKPQLLVTFLSFWGCKEAVMLFKKD